MLAEVKASPPVVCRALPGVQVVVSPPAQLQQAQGQWAASLGGTSSGSFRCGPPWWSSSEVWASCCGTGCVSWLCSGPASPAAPSADPPEESADDRWGSADGPLRERQRERETERFWWHRSVVSITSLKHFYFICNWYAQQKLKELFKLSKNTKTFFNQQVFAVEEPDPDDVWRLLEKWPDIDFQHCHWQMFSTYHPPRRRGAAPPVLGPQADVTHWRSQSRFCQPLCGPCGGWLLRGPASAELPCGKTTPWSCTTCSWRWWGWSRPRSPPGSCSCEGRFVSSWWKSPWGSWCGPGSQEPVGDKRHVGDRLRGSSTRIHCEDILKNWNYTKWRSMGSSADLISNIYTSFACFTIKELKTHISDVFVSTVALSNEQSKNKNSTGSQLWEDTSSVKLNVNNSSWVF